MVLLQPMSPEVPKPVVDPGFCVFEFIFLFRLWNCFMFKFCSLCRGWIVLSTSLFITTFFQWPSCVLFFVSNHSFFCYPWVWISIFLGYPVYMVIMLFYSPLQVFFYYVQIFMICFSSLISEVWSFIYSIVCRVFSYCYF